MMDGIDWKVVDDTHDDCVDSAIRECLNQADPSSFFLFAGAGSGKTRSLVSALEFLSKEYGKRFLQERRNVAVITYTNAACDEIKRRAQYNPLFSISTIHSFAWELIRTYTFDIKACLREELEKRIEENQSKQLTGKPSSQAYKDRVKKIEKDTARLRNLSSIKQFIYNPEGNNTEKNSLDHAEVIKICANLLHTKSTFRAILVDKYPIILIDESQDTTKVLMDVFLEIEALNRGKIILGLFGDTMQRIYLDGKDKIADSIPTEWEKPQKEMNHRSRKRIVNLCNMIRADADGIEQISRHDKPGGIVRVFVASRQGDSKIIEELARNQMATACCDEKWLSIENVKCLALEHHMAAKRLGFATFFEPLYGVDKYKQGVGKGNLAVISLFTKILLPLYRAYSEDNQFAIMRVIRENAVEFQTAIKGKSLTKETIDHVRDCAGKLLALWTDNDPKCIDLLRVCASENLFEIHSDLHSVLSHSENATQEDEKEGKRINALSAALDAPFSEIEKYVEYIAGNAIFDTHQGVKGLQFDRVMVVIDDAQAQGTTFNYGKLFGTVPKSKTDIENEQKGKESTIDRTRRLLYVTCSRAIDSLAIVFYSDSVETDASQIENSGWFLPAEIVKMTDEMQNATND